MQEYMENTMQGDNAWDFIRDYSRYDLKAILTKIADKRTPENEG